MKLLLKYRTVFIFILMTGFGATVPLQSSAAIIPQTNWKLQYTDSQELVGENGAAINAFDGNPSTIWHSEWKLNQPPLPHEIQIDLGLVYNLDGFLYLPRQDGGVNGTIAEYQFYVSADGKTWGSPVTQGSFAGNTTQKEVTFPTTAGRFVRLVATKEINNKVFTSVGELNVLGTLYTGNLAPQGTIDSPAATITVNQGGSVNFTGTGTDPDNNLPLTYRWNFGDPLIANAVAEDPGLIKFNSVGTYTVTFTVTDALGKSDPTPASRTVTVLDSTTTLLVPQTNWKLKYVDSQELIGENGAAVNAFDGNPATIWHSEWKLKQPPLPHEIQIDLGTVYSLNGFRYLPRQDIGVNGTIVQYQFYVSTDGINWGTPVAQGTYASDVTQKEVLFTATTGRFVRLVALKEINNKAFTSVAELNLIGTQFTGNLAPESIIDSPSGNITIDKGTSVNFAGTGIDPDSNSPLSYLWKFGDPAIANAVVEDPGLVKFNNVGTYTVTFAVTDALGKSDPTPASRIVTVLDSTTTLLVPQTNWKLKYFDSQELIGENGAAINAFDGNPATIWHTEWKLKQPPLPHEIQIDLGAVYTLNGFRYLPRQGGGVNGTIAQYNFYVSADGVNWGSPVTQGTLAADTTEKEVLFAATSGRFVRLQALKEINNLVFTSVAELKLLGTLSTGNLAPESSINSPAANITINSGGSVQFTGTGIDPDNNNPLTYRWTFGDPAIPNATVKDPGLVIFNNVGTYTVTFTVTDALGKIDPTPATRTVTVLSGTGQLVLPDWSDVTESPLKIGNPTNIINPVMTAAKVTDVTATFVADPFLYKEGSDFFMFFEVLNATRGLGEIGVASSKNAIDWKYEKIVLRESFHLSYPYIFSVNGKHYMIPESSQSQSVRIYEATNFPYEWKFVSTLLSGAKFLDPSVFYHNNLWWMFVGVGQDCRLYYSPNLLSGWKPHPKSPIVLGALSHSRPGGRVIAFDGDRIVRFVQKSDVSYGEQLRAYQVDLMTTTAYAEHEIAESPLLVPSGVGWNAAGMHNFDPLWNGRQWIGTVDARPGADFNSWSIGIYTTPDVFAPDSIIDNPITDVAINAGESVIFSGSASDPNGAGPFTYRWHFGDGSGIADRTVKDPGSIRFSNPGQYKVTFTVTNADGIVDAFPAARTVVVANQSGNQPPQGAIQQPGQSVTITLGQKVTFSGTASDPDNNTPLGYVWDFGDPAIPDAKVKDPGLVQFNKSGTYVVTFTAVDALGLADPTPAVQYIHVVDSGSNPQLPQINWSLRYVDSQELVGEDGAATNAFDGDTRTIWHTKYQGGAPYPPHEIQINLGTVNDIYGFRYLPRQDGGLNGRIGHYEFYVSSDGTSWGAPVASGAFVNSPFEKEIQFPVVTGKYIRLIAASEVNDQPYSTIAELNILGGSFSGNYAPQSTINSPAGNVTLSVGGSINFTGTGTDFDNNQPLTYLWDFGDPLIPSARVKDPGLIQFKKAGTYVVSFTVIDALGRADATPSTRVVNVEANTAENLVPQAGMSLHYVDSEELVGEDGAATNVFDGNVSTIWHTEWKDSDPRPPHEIQINLGSAYEIYELDYLPRQIGTNGTITKYEVYVSPDGFDWGTPVGTGTLGADSTLKRIILTPKRGQFIALVALRSINDQAWTTAAEINVKGRCTTPYIKILEPTNYGLSPSTSVAITPSVCLDTTQYPGWAVKFTLDGGRPYVDRTAPYGVTYQNVPMAEHTIQATFLDANGNAVSGSMTQDQVTRVGVGDYYVAIGDSITAGSFDDIAYDNISLDGRNVEGGYTPILNNLLTASKGYPHTVMMEAIPGFTSAEGLARLPEVLQRHPDSQYFLLLYGTNDSGGMLPVTPTKFKANMQQMINLIKSAGKKAYLAKLPFTMDAARNSIIRNYNVVIDQLVSENNILVSPPDFYGYFAAHQDELIDKLHPNGRGYQAMANMWHAVLQ